MNVTISRHLEQLCLLSTKPLAIWFLSQLVGHIQFLTLHHHGGGLPSCIVAFAVTKRSVLNCDKNRAIFFTTDRGFLVPTLVAATQVLNQPDVRAIADIFVFLVGFSEPEANEIRREFRDQPIIFQTSSPSRYSMPDEAVFRKTHVPPSALARLTVGRNIPEHYKHLTYFDGDIQIVGSILDLIRFDVPEGLILGATDRPYVKIPENDASARTTRDYLKCIGIKDPRDYFNSGVLSATRDTWISLSDKALQYFLQHSDRCRFHDQSALNAISVGHRLALSPRYNYVSTYAECEAEDMISPAVIHFTGAQKPWFADSRPWRGRFKESYAAILQAHPMLRDFPFMPDAEHMERTDRDGERAWKLLRLITPWRVPLRRRRIRRYLRETQFAV